MGGGAGAAAGGRGGGEGRCGSCGRPVRRRGATCSSCSARVHIECLEPTRYAQWLSGPAQWRCPLCSPFQHQQHPDFKLPSGSSHSPSRLSSERTVAAPSNASSPAQHSALPPSEPAQQSDALPKGSSPARPSTFRGSHPVIQPPPGKPGLLQRPRQRRRRVTLINASDESPDGGDTVQRSTSPMRHTDMPASGSNDTPTHDRSIARPGTSGQKRRISRPIIASDSDSNDTSANDAAAPTANPQQKKRTHRRTIVSNGDSDDSMPTRADAAAGSHQERKTQRRKFTQISGTDDDHCPAGEPDENESQLRPRKPRRTIMPTSGSDDSAHTGVTGERTAHQKCIAPRRHDNDCGDDGRTGGRTTNAGLVLRSSPRKGTKPKSNERPGSASDNRASSGGVARANTSATDRIGAKPLRRLRRSINESSDTEDATGIGIKKDSHSTASAGDLDEPWAPGRLQRTERNTSDSVSEHSDLSPGQARRSHRAQGDGSAEIYHRPQPVGSSSPLGRLRRRRRRRRNRPGHDCDTSKLGLSSNEDGMPERRRTPERRVKRNVVTVNCDGKDEIATLTGRPKRRTAPRRIVEQESSSDDNFVGECSLSVGPGRRKLPRRAVKQPTSISEGDGDDEDIALTNAGCSDEERQTKRKKPRPSVKRQSGNDAIREDRSRRRVRPRRAVKVETRLPSDNDEEVQLDGGPVEKKKESSNMKPLRSAKQSNESSSSDNIEIRPVKRRKAVKFEVPTGGDAFSRTVRRKWPEACAKPDCLQCGKLVDLGGVAASFCSSCRLPVHRSCLESTEISLHERGQWKCERCTKPRLGGCEQTGSPVFNEKLRYPYQGHGLRCTACRVSLDLYMGKAVSCKKCSKVWHRKCLSSFLKDTMKATGLNCPDCAQKAAGPKTSSKKEKSALAIAIKETLASKRRPQAIKKLLDPIQMNKKRLDLSNVKVVPFAKSCGLACEYCHANGSIPGGQGMLIGPLGRGASPIYVHRNCALWDSKAHFLRPSDLPRAAAMAQNSICSKCRKPGAAISCLFQSCGETYHFQCAVEDRNYFILDPKFAVICRLHSAEVDFITSEDDSPLPYFLFHFPENVSIDPALKCTECTAEDGWHPELGQLMVCEGCKKAVHRFCRPDVGKRTLNPTIEDKMPYKYYCMDCQTCGQCEKPVADTKFKECEVCNVVLHCGVCIEPHLQRPEDVRQMPWVCKKCLLCAHCERPTVALENAIDCDYPLCFDCSQEVVQGNYCPVCSRCYKQDDTYPMVECEACKLWTHYYCAKVTQVDEYDNRDYVCLTCEHGYQSTIQTAQTLQEAAIEVTPRDIAAAAHEDTTGVVPEVGIAFLSNPDARDGEAAAAGAELCKLCCSAEVDEDNMRFCCDCGEAYHNFCFEELTKSEGDSPPNTARRKHLDLQAGRAGVGKPLWRCPRCSVCEICTTSERESSIILCDGCDKGYHQDCLVPALTCIPDGEWLCSSCRSCQLCGTEPCSNVDGADLCEVCASDRQHPRECYICHELWTAGGALSGPRLLKCSSCDVVVHPSCAGMANDVARLFDGKVNRYFCKACKLSGYGHEPFSFGELPLDCLLDRIRGETTTAVSLECLQIGDSRIFVGLSSLARDRIKAIETGDSSAIKNITTDSLQNVLEGNKVSGNSRKVTDLVRRSHIEKTNCDPVEQNAPGEAGERWRSRNNFRTEASVIPPVGDSRRCSICLDDSGDSGRLLFVKSLVWVHIGCLLWSPPFRDIRKARREELPLGEVMELIQRARRNQCDDCGEFGASIECDKPSCDSLGHLDCILERRGSDCWQFTESGSVFCSAHRSKSGNKWCSVLFSHRPTRIEWDLDWQRSRAAEVTGDLIYPLPWSNVASFADVGIRVGALTVVRLGTLLSDPRFVIEGVAVPLGYEAVRLFWSGSHPGERCRYLLKVKGSRALGPKFCIEASDSVHLQVESDSIEEAWSQVLDRVENLRRGHGMSVAESVWRAGCVFGAFEAFGLSIGAVVCMLERQPGSKILPQYVHRYVSQGELRKLDGRIEQVHRRGAGTNPTGSARSEGYARRTQTSSGPSYRGMKIDEGDLPVKEAVPTSDGKLANVLPVAFQHRNMLKTWKKRTQIRRSGIEGWGLYAIEVIEMGSMIIEYAGELFRPILADARERYYEERGKGTYMFRVDDHNIVDATMRGNWARFINHSCDPNCMSQLVTVEGDRKAIVIVSLRRIQPGEELSYDYKFPFEDEKLPCNCGAEKCKGTLN